jgi:hypothetical protein
LVCNIHEIFVRHMLNKSYAVNHIGGKWVIEL